MPVAEEPRTELDRALLRLIEEALAEIGDDIASVEHTWGEAAGLWFVEVTPRRPGAAHFTAAVDGDAVTITAGKTWFEVFPIKAVDDMAYIRQIASAVFHGDMEEAGLGECFARIRLADGRVASVGRVHMPLPWKLRRRRRYLGY